MSQYRDTENLPVDTVVHLPFAIWGTGISHWPPAYSIYSWSSDYWLCHNVIVLFFPHYQYVTHQNYTPYHWNMKCITFTSMFLCFLICHLLFDVPVSATDPLYKQMTMTVSWIIFRYNPGRSKTYIYMYLWSVTSLFWTGCPWIEKQYICKNSILLSYKNGKVPRQLKRYTC